MMLIGLKTKVMGLIWPFEFIWPSSSKLAMLHIDLFLISKETIGPNTSLQSTKINYRVSTLSLFVQELEIKLLKQCSGMQDDSSGWTCKVVSLVKKWLVPMTMGCENLLENCEVIERT
jgi:hypothetical protein